MRTDRLERGRTMIFKKLGWIIVLSTLILMGCNDSSDLKKEIPYSGELNHVHGIGYAGNDGGLYFAAHTGLKIYREGEWFAISDNFFDYMGFNAIDQGFYTSGHPSADSNMPNPLGIQKSLDGGKSLEHIAFEGETDFHTMAVGYISQDIFLLNPEANTELDAGFYKLSREDEQWENVKGTGLEGEVSALALHPTDSNIVAAATSKGIYISENSGVQFERITDDNETGTAIFFNENELFYASSGKSAMLTKYTVSTKGEEKVSLPNLTQDVVAFISQNPANKKEIGIYTMQGEVFLTQDNGSTWLPLLQGGKVD